MKRVLFRPQAARELERLMSRAIATAIHEG